MTKTTSRPTIGLVVGGRWHDFEFARRELLGELAEHPLARTLVRDSYTGLEGIDALITYTCDVVPDARQQTELVEFVERGGRWLALHASNSAIIPAEPGLPYKFVTPRAFGRVAEVLGSQFLAHPPIEPYRVDVADPTHPLVEGIGPFEVSDELYVSELHPPLHVILDVEFNGLSPSFEEGHQPASGRHPVLYTRDFGAGSVTFFGLGHCRGRYDVQDLGIDDLGVVDRGPWDVPEFRTILRRGVAWAVNGHRS